VRTLLIEKIPFFLLTAAFAVVTMIAQRHGGAMTVGESYPLTLRLGNALASHARYIALTFCPRHLAIIYPYHGALRGTHLPMSNVVIGGLLLISVTVLGVWLWRRRGEGAPLIGWLWFLGMLVPVIGVIQVGWQSMADRYTYLPQIGLLIAIVWTAQMLLAHVPRSQAVATALGSIAVAVFAVRTDLELRHWRDNITLFTHALSVTDHNHIAHGALGLALDEMHEIPAAIDQYKLAVEITPDQPQLYYNIGRLYLIAGDLPQAEAWLQKALALDPKFVDALINLAKTRARMDRHDEAISLLQQALAIDGKTSAGHYELAVELAEQDRVNDALPHFAEAIRIEPDVPELHYSYSKALRQSGQIKAADLAYQRYFDLARARGAAPLPIPTTNPDNRRTSAK
jgi:Flp pilus assembly protein TadD